MIYDTKKRLLDVEWIYAVPAPCKVLCEQIKNVGHITFFTVNGQIVFSVFEEKGNVLTSGFKFDMDSTVDDVLKHFKDKNICLEE